MIRKQIVFACLCNIYSYSICIAQSSSTLARTRTHTYTHTRTRLHNHAHPHTDSEGSCSRVQRLVQFIRTDRLLESTLWPEPYPNLLGEWWCLGWRWRCRREERWRVLYNIVRELGREKRRQEEEEEERYNVVWETKRCRREGMRRWWKLLM